MIPTLLLGALLYGPQRPAFNQLAELPSLDLQGHGALGELELRLEDGLPHGRVCLQGGELLVGGGLQPNFSVWIELDGEGDAQVPLGLERRDCALRVVAPSRFGTLLASSSIAWQVQMAAPRHPLQTGVLRVTEYMKDPTGVADSSGEWLEIFNPGSVPVDLAGWRLSDFGSNSHTIGAPPGLLVVPSGGRRVLGRERDPGLNGGVPVAYAYSGFTLSNGDDEIVLTSPLGLVADVVAYDDGVLWPDDPGRSASLGTLGDALSADAGLAWCSSTSTMAPGSPDMGTPARANDTCP